MDEVDVDRGKAVRATYIFPASVIATLISTPLEDRSFNQSCRAMGVVAGMASRSNVLGGMVRDAKQLDSRMMLSGRQDSLIR
jgi:hypothetical protein